MNLPDREEPARAGEAPAGISDSESVPGYSARVTSDASLPHAVIDSRADHQAAADQPLPASLYRSIRPAAWLAVLAAGVAGWALLYALI